MWVSHELSSPNKKGEPQKNNYLPDAGLIQRKVDGGDGWYNAGGPGVLSSTTAAAVDVRGVVGTNVRPRFDTTTWFTRAIVAVVVTAALALPVVGVDDDDGRTNTTSFSTTAAAVLVTGEGTDATLSCSIVGGDTGDGCSKIAASSIIASTSIAPDAVTEEITSGGSKGFVVLRCGSGVGGVLITWSDSAVTDGEVVTTAGASSCVTVGAVFSSRFDGNNEELIVVEVIGAFELSISTVIPVRNSEFNTIYRDWWSNTIHETKRDCTNLRVEW
jgi:hypothetical protein